MSFPDRQSRKLQESISAGARRARESLGFAQEDVAHVLGLSPKFYARLDRGAAMPSVPTLRKMCLVLLVSADELLGHRPLDEKKPLSAEFVARLLDTPRRRRLAKILRRASPRTLLLLDALLTAVFRTLRGRHPDP